MFVRPIASSSVSPQNGELSQLVTASNQQYGEEIFRRLPHDPSRRAASVNLFLEICSWRSLAGASGWANALHAALDPARPEQVAELKGLVQAAGAQYGLDAFWSLPKEPEKRARSAALFQEICGWRSLVGESGWATPLLQAVDPDRPDQVAELKGLVQAAGAQHGLDAFKSLPKEPEKRARSAALFQEICGWRSLVGESGWANPLLQAVDPDRPEQVAELKGLVQAAGAQYGLDAFKSLPKDSQKRARSAALFQEICGWRSLVGESGWANLLLQAVDPDRPDQVAELKDLVRAAGAQYGLDAYKRLPQNPEKRAKSKALFEEICGWRSQVGESGWANSLHAALDPDRPEQAAELRQLVKAAGAQYGLDAYRSLPAQNRAEAIATFVEICEARSLLGESGWANSILGAVLQAERPDDARAFFLARLKTDSAEVALSSWKTFSLDSPVVRGLALRAGDTDPGLREVGAWVDGQDLAPEHVTQSLSALEPERALALLRHLHATDAPDFQASLDRLVPLLQGNDLDVEVVLETARLDEPPRGASLGEDGDHWIIGGVALKKREDGATAPAGP